MSDPEARGVAERAFAQLQRLSSDCAELRLLTKKNDKETVFELLRSKVSTAAKANYTAVRHCAFHFNIPRLTVSGNSSEKTEMFSFILLLVFAAVSCC